MDSDPANNPIDMTEFESDILTEQIPGLGTELAKFDQLREDSYAQLDDVAGRFSQIFEGRDAAHFDMSELLEQFTNVLTVFARENTALDEIANYGATLLLGDEEARIDRIKLIITDEKMGKGYRKSKPKSIHGEFADAAELLEDSESLIECLASYYGQVISHDVSMFFTDLEYMARKAAQDVQPEAEDGGFRVSETFVIKKELRDHAADIAKVAVGVTIAMAADRFLRRKG